MHIFCRRAAARFFQNAVCLIFLVKIIEFLCLFLRFIENGAFNEDFIRNFLQTLPFFTEVDSVVLDHFIKDIRFENELICFIYEEKIF